MIKSSYRNWPVGLERRWISINPKERINKLYVSGRLDSSPHEHSHLVVSLDDEYPYFGIPTCRWNLMPRDFSLEAIVAYDIVDHLPSYSDVRCFLSSCRDSLAPDGVLYLFCHPFKSRLGNHLFERNMAYFHLIRGTEGVHTLRIDDPLGFYRREISVAGMEIKDENIYKEPIEDFFNRFSLDSDCEIQFVEYFLKHRSPK